MTDLMGKVKGGLYKTQEMKTQSENKLLLFVTQLNDVSKEDAEKDIEN